MKSIHQIEITSRCNLRCKYCVHPKMSRAKLDMSKETFDRSLYWVRRFCAEGTQGNELNLCGIGESTLHPMFDDFVLRARLSIGRNRDLILATNGIGVTEQQADAMHVARMRVWVSLHRPEAATNTVNMLRDRGVLAGISTDPATAGVDWAGQVKWETTARCDIPCPWLLRQQAFVMADGNIGTCCFDGAGTGVLGTVWDDVTAMESIPYNLCEACHHVY